jgi:curved DNA-binding protein CbpA
VSDLYETLGVASDASPADIKRARRAKAGQLHPDRAGGNASSEAMADVNKAYDVLVDPRRRAEYDEHGTIDGAPDVDKLARNMLSEAFEKSLEAAGVNIVRVTGAALKDALGNITMNELSVRQQLRGLERRRAKVRTKDGAPNIVHDIIDRKVKTLNEALNGAGLARKVVLRAQQLLKSYEDDEQHAEPIDPFTRAWLGATASMYPTKA